MRLGQLTREELGARLGASFQFQRDFIRNERQFEVIVKARQIGFTTVIACRTLLNSILNDDYVSIIVSPTQRQSNRVKRYIDKQMLLLEKITGMKIETTKNREDHVIYSCGSEDELVKVMPEFLASIGPSFLELNVKKGSRKDLGRPTIKPVDNKKDFMKNLIGN